jgi:CubicO group peptidase (beta-lactamase class C family)
MNIASISKTVTATAVMQLWEDGRVNLDQDINAHLPFEVRNPHHPGESITVRQLLTHTSSIGDSALYRQSYACGDPQVSLPRWIEGYLIEGGEYYRSENWHDWRPGEGWDYSNVGFGLLGYLVEAVSGVAFGDYVRTHILGPLGMTETSWYLADLDRTKHAIPYTYVADGKMQGELVTENDGRPIEIPDEGFIPNCLYSFYNISDGLLRTSVRQLARYLSAYMNHGSLAGKRILAANTVQEMLSDQIDAALLPEETKGQGLAWYQAKANGTGWGHGGRDPGVSTEMRLRSDGEVGVIVFTNTGRAELDGLVEKLMWL